MSINFSNSFDSAVLTKIIDLAKEHGNKKIGRTSMQKLAYFAKVFGIPLSFSHRIYYYGPYSENVADSIDNLLMDGVIIDESDNSGSSKYIPGAMSQELMLKYDVDLKKYDDVLVKLVKSLEVDNPRNLELISTLHYCIRELKVRYNRLPSVSEITDRFKEIKESKFSGEQIQEGFQILDSVGLLDPMVCVCR